MVEPTPLSPPASGAAALMTVLTQKFAQKFERYDLPAWGWNTKGFEFWTFLSLLLLRSNPSRLLELGTGRSTVLFAEYAMQSGGKLTSIETNRRWYHKARMEMRWQNLPVEQIHLLTIDPAIGWYDVDQFRALRRDPHGFDFVLVDGPNADKGDSHGFRNCATAVREIGAACAGADVIIVDDVHRRHVFETVDPMLSDPDQYEKWYYRYRAIPAHLNALCLCIRRGSDAGREIEQIQASMGLHFSSSMQSDECPED